MSLRYAQRRDKNEPEIVQAVRGVGAVVEYMDASAAFDLLVIWFGSIYIAEVKQPGEKLTPNEQALADRLTGVGGHLHIWHNPEEALATIGAIW